MEGSEMCNVSTYVRSRPLTDTFFEEHAQALHGFCAPVEIAKGGDFLALSVRSNMVRPMGGIGYDPAHSWSAVVMVDGYLCDYNVDDLIRSPLISRQKLREFSWLKDEVEEQSHHILPGLTTHQQTFGEAFGLHPEFVSYITPDGIVTLLENPGSVHDEIAIRSGLATDAEAVERAITVLTPHPTSSHAAIEMQSRYARLASFTQIAIRDLMAWLPELSQVPLRFGS